MTVVWLASGSTRLRRCPARIASDWTLRYGFDCHSGPPRQRQGVAGAGEAGAS